ncbi:MAG: cupin domain-containing protein [Alphaproteobacteria bacterium]
MTNQPRPAKVHHDAVPWIPADAAPTKVRIRRLITRGRHGSELMLGVCVMDPGEETNVWSSAPENDAKPGEQWYGPVEETYYCIRGRLTLHWDDGEIEFGPEDAVYLAPGWHYQLENTGDEQAFFVYHMYPSPA